jgi:hypothetical protein
MPLPGPRRTADRGEFVKGVTLWRFLAGADLGRVVKAAAV